MSNSDLFHFLANRISSPSDITISLPEKDERVTLAAKKLRGIGLNILTNELLPPSIDQYVSLIKGLKFSENWLDNSIREFLENPLIKSLVMMKNKETDGVICGCTMPTANVIRNAIRIIGISDSSNWVSSMFLMADKSSNKFYTFADCAVIPEPSSEQLSEIAEKGSLMHKRISGEDPYVAFLSFSTKGSAEHYRVSNVRKAVELFGKKNPNIPHDGEIQLDAAINKKISATKIDDSKLKGNANILIFPNLDAGNISYKLTQQLAGYYACGPLLLGLNQPVNDLSRGASVDDIVLISLITAIQAKNL